MNRGVDWSGVGIKSTGIYIYTVAVIKNYITLVSLSANWFNLCHACEVSMQTKVHGWTSFVNRHLQPCRLVLVPTILLVQIAARAGWDYSTGGVGLRPSCHTLLDRGYWHVLGQSPVKYLFFLEWHQSGSPADDFSLVCSLALVPWCKDEASKWHAAIRIGGLVGWAEHFRKRIHTWIPYLEKNAWSGRAADTGMWFPNEWFSPSHSPCFKHSNSSTTLHSIFIG